MHLPSGLWCKSFSIGIKEFGVGDDHATQVTNEVGCVEELQSDESLEQEQREIALSNEDDIKLVGFQKVLFEP